MSNEIARIVNQSKEAAGFMSVLLKHHVVKTDATFTFTGPRISREMWNQVLAYFKWVYDTTKSECQVRLYVNAVAGVWSAWAYPQEARTGMSAREVDNENAQQQRAQFASTAGWLYFGTVHHHCSAGAFQSSVDESNEKAQDGLHITIGHMDKAEYDIDCRLYIGGIKFQPNMEWFWDCGDEVQLLPAWVRKLLPDKPNNLVAREQMCAPAPAETQFPQQWKDNLIAIQPVVTTVTSYDGGMGYHRGSWQSRKAFVKRAGALKWDKDRAVEDILDWLKDQPEATKPTDGEIIQSLGWMAQELDDTMLDLLDICAHRDLLPSTLLQHIHDLEEAQFKKELAKEQKANQGNCSHGKGTVPDYEDAALQTWLDSGGGHGGLPM